MSTGHRFLSDYGKALSPGGTHTVVAPSSGGTFEQKGLAFATAVVGAGTYKVPDNGLPMYVRATGAVNIDSVAGVRISTLASGQMTLLLPTSSSTWTALTSGPSVPAAKKSTSATTTTVVPGAGALTGAAHVYWENTADGALGLTTRTAAELYGDIPGVYAGYAYNLTIVNRGNNTITITGGGDVSIEGETTIATLVTRTYVVEVNSTLDVTMISVAKGTIET